MQYNVLFLFVIRNFLNSALLSDKTSVVQSCSKVRLNFDFKKFVQQKPKYNKTIKQKLLLYQKSLFLEKLQK